MTQTYTIDLNSRSSCTEQLREFGTTVLSMAPLTNLLLGKLCPEFVVAERTIRLSPGKTATLGYTNPNIDVRFKFRKYTSSHVLLACRLHMHSLDVPAANRVIRSSNGLIVATNTPVPASDVHQGLMQTARALDRATEKWQDWYKTHVNVTRRYAGLLGI
jgi:hypothetical protein